MYPTPLPKSFVCGDGTFKWFGLTNTKKRTKTLKDSLHPDESTCRLVDAGEGVIWMGIGVGHALFNAADMITVTNDKGEQLQPICWVDAGVMMGNTITRMFFAGPEDSNSFIVCCGDSCAQASGD
jgi:hypothetical protein